MKKFTKFIGIFLALSLVIGLIPVVGAVDPETPTAPAAPTGAILQGTTYEVVSPTRIETLFGFYEDGTGADEDTFMDCEDGACVTDGWFGRAGYSECTSDDGLIALVMMVDDFINLGAIEIVAKNAEHRPTDFVIQVMGDSDWETVVTADDDPLASGLTKTFTFDTVETDTVRILINAVDVNSDDGQCYLNEVTLFEAVTGDLKTVIDMNGKVTDSNANTADCTNNAVDGDKSTFFTGSHMTVTLGEATAIDGFSLYHYRNNAFPNNITVSIQQTEGGEFVTIGTFPTGFTSGAPVDSLYVTFDQTYMAYAITFNSDVWGYQNDYELWQYQREAEEEPTVAPTEPAEPTYELTTGAPTTGVAYKWAADTGAAEGILTFIGTSANQSYYLSTSTTMTEGVDVYVEEVTGGYQMYFMAGETKTYIDIYQNGTYVNARLTTEPTAVFTWNDTFGTFVTDISGTAYYLGTYTKASTGVTYTTLSASKLSYMTESNVDVSQFPARFYAEVGAIIPEPTEAPTEEPTPAPTEEPTPAPTEEPTPAPTEEPTPAPTEEPTPPTEAPTAPTEAPAPEYTWIDLIPESQLTPAVGYYNEGDYTTLTDINSGESGLLTDARVSSGSWVNGNTFPVPNGKVPAAVVEVDGTKIFAGVNICCKPGQELTDFVIEVKNTNGDWVTVNTTAGNTETDVKIIFDTAVLGSAVRMIINDWNGEHPMVQELWVYEGLNTEPLVQVPVAGVTASQNPVVAEQSVDLVIDGKGYTYYQIGAGNMPVDIIFDTTNADGSATNVSRMRIYAFNNSKQAAKDIVVSVKTANEPETWETVYTGVAYELNHTDTFVVDFGATYAAFDVRLTINTVTSDNLVLTGVELFGNGEPVAPPVVTPTDPTEEPTQAPTEEPTEEPTAPPEEPTEEPTQAPTETPTVPGEALPEAPVVVPGTTTIAGGVVKEGTVYKLISTKKITTGFGYYDASGAFVDMNDGVCVTDGWYGRSGYSECTSADGQIALIMTLDEVKNIGRVEIVGRTVNGAADNRPVDFEIQALVNGEWITVADVDDDPFATSMTVAYTFPAVATNQIRILINEVIIPTNQCHLNEVELYEVTTGKIYNDIDLTGKITATDAHDSAPAEQLIDGDKDTYFLGANVTFNLTDTDGNPTSVDGFRMFHYRGNQGFASSVTVLVQTTPGGEFTALNAYVTGWMNTVPQDQVIVEFDETVTVYGMQVNLDSYSYVNEFELFQYEKDEAPEEPPVDPTPTDPTVTPSEPGTTEPSVTPTEPSVTPTEPSVTPTEPEATDPSEDPTEPEEPGNDLDFTELEDAFALLETLDPEDFTEDSVAAVENALANILMMDENVTQEELDEAVQALLDAIDALVPVEDEGTDEPGDDLPDVPVLPGAPDLTEIQATIDRIYDLDPDKYTSESYANLIAVVKDVNKMLATEGGYSQKLIDSANEKLLNALDALVLIDGEGDSNGDDLPAPTGDIALAVLGSLMSLSAIGGAVVIGKKKFF